MFSNNIKIPYSHLSFFSPQQSLASHYISSFDQVKEFYEADYRSLDNISQLRNQAQIDPAQRKRLVEILLNYNKEKNNSPKVLANIEALAAKDCFTVITGQQCGLFTGPLFTIYKAITTVLLAEKLNQAGQGNYIPVFWAASEDHDVAEINQISYANMGGELETLSLDIHEQGLSVSDIDLNNQMDQLIANLKEKWQPTEFSAEIFELLEQNKNSFSQSFIGLISHLFKDYGLVLVEPYLLREFSISINETALNRNEEIYQLLTESSERLIKSGYTPAIQMTEALNLFYYHRKKRCKLLWNDSSKRFESKDKELAISHDELLSKIQQQPELFSQNVVLRPIVQDSVFPNVAYIAGPGEIQYFAQLKDVYGLFNKSMPVIYPRVSLTLFEKKYQKIQKRFHFDIEEILSYQLDGKSHDFFQRFENEQGVNRFVCCVEKAIGELMTDAELKGKNVVDSLQPSIRKLKHESEKIKEKYLKKIEENLGISKKQIEKLKNGLIPKMKPQERVFNYFYYMNYYGPGLLEHIIREIDIEDFSRQVLYYG